MAPDTPPTLRPPLGSVGTMRSIPPVRGLAGKVACCTFWSANRTHYCLIGTRAPGITFVDLRTGATALTVRLRGQPPSSLEVVGDADNNLQYLLVHSDRPTRLLLQQQLMVDQAVETETIIESWKRPAFAPAPLRQFHQKSSLRRLLSKGKNVVTHLDTDSGRFTLEVFDAGLSQHPLFVYQLPEASQDVFLTDNVFFTYTNHASARIYAVSSTSVHGHTRAGAPRAPPGHDVGVHSTPEPPDLCQFASVRAAAQRGRSPVPPPPCRRHLPQLTPPRHHAGPLPGYLAGTSSEGAAGEPCSSEAILQQFVLPADDSVVAIFPRPADAASEDRDPLGGCCVVTSTGILECVSAAPPEKLFRRILLAGANPEPLGATLHLDLDRLYQQAAEDVFASGDVQAAMELYLLARTPHEEILPKFAAGGHLWIITNYLRRQLSNPGSLPHASRKQMANLLLLCCKSHPCSQRARTRARARTLTAYAHNLTTPSPFPLSPSCTFPLARLQTFDSFGWRSPRSIPRAPTWSTTIATASSPCRETPAPAPRAAPAPSLAGLSLRRQGPCSSPWPPLSRSCRWTSCDVPLTASSPTTGTTTPRPPCSLCCATECKLPCTQLAAGSA